MTTVPGASAVTRPVAETVAVAVFDDCHVARAVTSCVVPSDIAAVAVSGDVPPAAGADPLTVIAETNPGVVVVFPHAAANPAMATMTTRAQSDRPVRTRRKLFITAPLVAASRTAIHAAAVPVNRAPPSPCVNVLCSFELNREDGLDVSTPLRRAPSSDENTPSHLVSDACAWSADGVSVGHVVVTTRPSSRHIFRIQ
jgi:hypothetical protein